MRVALCCCAAALACNPANPNAAEPAPYPARPIRLIVPTVPGTPPDIVARLLGERLASTLGQPLVIDNRPGAIGSIGLGQVARAAPDGYTLGLLAMPYLLASSLLPGVTSDVEKDLAPIALLAFNYTILAVSSASSPQTVGELIALARSRPGALKFSSNGNGTPPHLAGELFKRETATSILHVPYKGSIAGTHALLAGEVDFTFGTVAVLSPHISAGRLRALATAAPQRLVAFPEVASLRELGYERLVISDWQGLVAPAGTSPRLIAKVYRSAEPILSRSEFTGRLDALGMVAARMSTREFEVHVVSEARRWRELVRAARIRVD